jgi:FlaA1/EpsC-like NDP-sugar epimerase
MRNLFIAYRRFFVVLVHLLLWTVALAASLLLRFEFEVPRAVLRLVPTLLLITLVSRALVHWRVGLFHGLWRYSGTRDLLSLLQAAAVSSAMIAAIWAFMKTGNFPRSVLFLDFAFSILIVGGLRFGIRTVREISLQSTRSDSDPHSSTTRRRVLVIGAGDAGEMLMREITRTYAHRYEPVGFLDDAPAKQKERIHGVPVIGPISDIVLLAKRERIDEIILAIPTMTGPDIRRLVELCRPTGASLRTLPGVDRLIDGRVTVSQLSEVAIEDLLGRAPVTLDAEAIEGFLRDRIVVVTGAGGSIGSELCKQICRFAPAKLILLEQAENNLFEIHRALLAEFPDVKVTPYIADICDSRRVDSIFEHERPAVVFHAAAHKHVPMMEWNPGEAIKNNVFGTKKLADSAHRHDVEFFVMVSTDKAVNPTSVMGVSKRTAEIYVQALSQRSQTQFVTVRFGNVLGSAGSVIPIFKQQIARGGPVMVTHPEMQRYFMTIPEACQLILQAGTMGRGGDIFVLDMGKPVKIVDLARDLIRLSGYSDGDIAIEFSGMRPGEKLFEELSLDAEKATKTRHPKIFVGTFRPYAWEDVERALERLHGLSEGSAAHAVRAAFRELVPEYTPPSMPPPAADANPVPELPVRAPAEVVPERPLPSERISTTDRVSATAG